MAMLLSTALASSGLAGGPDAPASVVPPPKTIELKEIQLPDLETGPFRPRLTGLLDSKVDELMRHASKHPSRAVRLVSIHLLGMVGEAGSRQQRKRARQTLERLTGDPDPIIAAETSWYLKQRWHRSLWELQNLLTTEDPCPDEPRAPAGD